MIKMINRTPTAWLVLFDVIDTELHQFLARDLNREAAEQVVREAEALGPEGRKARKLEQDKLSPDWQESSPGYPAGIYRGKKLRQRCECGRLRRWHNSYCNQDEAVLMDAYLEEKRRTT